MRSVAISSGNNIKVMVERCLTNLGGLNQIIRPDQTVFIKPDLSLPLGPPITIHPQILGYIVKSCIDLGAKEVYIGFNPFDGISSDQLLTLLGLKYYLTELNATLLNLEQEKFISVEISDPIYFETLYVPEKLMKSDVLISLVAPRTDVFGEYALGVKNYFGLLNDEQKQQILRTGTINGLLDYFKIKPPQLTIWDAMIIGEGQGPFNQRAVPYNLILSSTDLIVGDSVIARLMGLNPLQSELFKLVVDRHLGTIESDHITIIGDELPNGNPIQKATILTRDFSEQFEIIEGDTCPGCRICLQYLLDFLLRFIKKDLREFGGFSIFLGKLPSDIKYKLKTGVLIFGNCALSSNFHIEFKNKTQKKKQFFTFPGCPPLNLRLVEKFCLNFKEWLPSLEIIEEFVRNWTKGRRYISLTASPKLVSSKRKGD